MMSTVAFSRVLVQGLSGMCPEDRAGEWPASDSLQREHKPTAHR